MVRSHIICPKEVDEQIRSLNLELLFRYTLKIQLKRCVKLTHKKKL